MYFHFNNHIYLAEYNEDLIILDIIKDKYIICSSEVRVCIFFLLKNQVSNMELEQLSNNIQSVPINFYQVTSALVQENILNQKLQTTPYKGRIGKAVSQGVFSARWELYPKDLIEKDTIRNTFIYLWTLLKVRILLNVMGLKYSIQKIKDTESLNNISVPQIEIDSLIQGLNKACLLFPTKTKCLEWAISFVLLARKRKLPCNLVIGVQTVPFFAHAWVEINGKALADSLDIAENVAVILSEPLYSQVDL